jgi:hypothetical protein
MVVPAFVGPTTPIGEIMAIYAKRPKSKKKRKWTNAEKAELDAFMVEFSASVSTAVRRQKRNIEDAGFPPHVAGDYDLLGSIIGVDQAEVPFGNWQREVLAYRERVKLDQKFRREADAELDGQRLGLRRTHAERKATVAKLVNELGKDTSVKTIIKTLKARRIPQRQQTTREILRELKDEGKYTGAD